ncbi:hypothetical protein CPB86DRAFT_711956 [Serendipita vermifera]|nr:hypothetical protein CPB86DRAFT_711956 [Serendipita vermifera]
MLKTERWKVVERIKKIQQSSHLTDSTNQLEEFKDKYNRIMDAISVLEAKSSVDPLEKLPEEICRMIISEAVSMVLPFPKAAFDFNRAILLTLVSTRCQRLILDMPLLWTNIHVGSQTHDSLAMLMTCLTLSRDLPIHLRLLFPLGGVEAILPSLVQNGDRIEGIYIH